MYIFTYHTPSLAILQTHAHLTYARTIHTDQHKRTHTFAASAAAIPSKAHASPLSLAMTSCWHTAGKRDQFRNSTGPDCAEPPPRRDESVPWRPCPCPPELSYACAGPIHSLVSAQADNDKAAARKVNDIRWEEEDTDDVVSVVTELLKRELLCRSSLRFGSRPPS